MKPVCYLGIRALFLHVLLMAWSTVMAQSSFEVHISPGFSVTPVDGRLYVLIAPDTNVIPAINLQAENVILAADVKQWKPGTPLLIDGNAMHFPVGISDLPEGKYAVQALIDINTTERAFNTAAGNGYSQVLITKLSKAGNQLVRLDIDKSVPERRFEETGNIKEVKVRSKLLSTASGRTVDMKAAIILPPSYNESQGRKYPVVYIIPEFDGSYYNVSSYQKSFVNNAVVEKIYVVLDAECRYGNHLFADSDNNGPWGTALVKELIPEIERRFNIASQASSRLLAGYSSGGWSSLWLQVNHPDLFGGAWAIAPDPVDFTSFLGVNIYTPEANVFWIDKKQQQLRTLDRFPGEYHPSYKEFSDREMVIGEGEQLQSYESVFSGKAADGRPMPLWDRMNGIVNAAVAKNWKKYDIKLFLLKHTSYLKKLNGKLHISVGDKDTYLLEQSVRALADGSEQDGWSNAIKVNIYQGEDHFSIFPAAREKVNDEIDQVLSKGIYSSITR